MRVPQVDNIDDELRRDFLEQVVAVVVLVHVALHVCGLLEDQISLRRRRLGPIDLRLGHKLAAGRGLGDLDRF